MNRAKYFVAETHADAEAAAIAYFACGKEMLTIEVVRGGREGETEWEILAIRTDADDSTHMDAYFSIFYESEGVYLEIYEMRGAGKDFVDDRLINYIARKNINGINMDIVHKLKETRCGRAKIAAYQPEYIFGEDLSIIVSGDETEATARLLEPEPGGAELTIDAARQKVAEAGVVVGIDDATLSQMLGEKIYDKPYVIATATPPVDGEDGKIIFNFSTDELTGAPRVIDDSGKVDYRLLDLYVPVEENQLLVTRTLATEGTAGVSVKGTTIKQKKSKEVVMPRGKNVNVNEDRTEMHSICAGLVEFINGTVTVSNVYKVNGDVDMSVGNIDFDGSVHITGTIRSGHVVKATGGITVDGSIEAATVMSGGNVEVKGGMQGAGKGKIEAKGAVSVLFIERGIIIADGHVKVDVCVHSTVETSSTLHALGKRGAIIGGHVTAANDIVANFIGALSGAKTEIEVGVMPRKRARVQEIEKELERIKTETVKLDQLDTYLERTKGSTPPETWQKLHVSGIANRKTNEEDYQRYTGEIKSLQYDISHAHDAKVHVFETTFNGSRITIGNASLRVTDEVIFATYKFSEGEVVCRSCEVSKEDYKK